MQAAAQRLGTAALRGLLAVLALTMTSSSAHEAAGIAINHRFGGLHIKKMKMNRHDCTNLCCVKALHKPACKQLLDKMMWDPCG